MTAEIAILNKNGVALAADSKVTIGSGSSGKTFDTVNKVFTISKVHPVGVMIFGNAEFMRYPWETIVKIYRSGKKSDSHNTISEWGEDFVNHISSFGDISDDERKINMEAVVFSALGEMRRAIQIKARLQKVATGSSEFISLAKEHISSSSDELNDEQYFDVSYMNKFKTNYSSSVDGIVDDLIGKLTGGDSDIKATATEYIYKLVSGSSFSPASSGIVIAGFGDKELFPSIAHYETDGYLGSKNKIRRADLESITRANPSCVMPFAQHEMVERFMEGVDPIYFQYLTNGIEKIMLENCLSVLDNYGDSASKGNIKIREAIKSAVTASLEVHKKQCDGFQLKYYTMPIISMVSLLPKDELPHLAESLVALTSLKRHVSHDEETVGGPIDVALISKGDGFVWIKRKHYFKVELNQQFAANYRRDID